MSDGQSSQSNYPPIVAEDLIKLGVESQFIPFVVSATQWAEQSPNGSPPLSTAEAESIVEILDKLVSSNTVNPSLKNRCLRVLRKLSPSQGILPKSYYPDGVALSDSIPYASGGFADIWKGQRSEVQVCVKAFRTQTAANLDKIKRRFYREIIAWKYVSHPNVLPFFGVSETLFSFCIICPWLANGNITDYAKKNERVNRLQLLAQAACGLEYLHSLSIVHSDVNPGNILITDNGIACLGDFGITGVITDPTVVEPGSTTTSKPGVVRYMAPELLNPSQFSLSNSNPSKESDIYSLAMTAYETLSGILPYGTARDGIIIFHVVTGNRPPRPEDTRWLRDPIWNMIMTCWSEKREQRLDIHAVYNQFSVASIQEIAENPRDDQTQQRPLTIVADVLPELPKDLPEVPQAPEEERTLPEDPAVHAQSTARVKQAKAKLKKQLRSQTDPASDASGTSPPRRRFSWPALSALSALPRGDDGNGESTQRSSVPRRERRLGMSLARGWIRLRGVFRAFKAFRLLKKKIRRRKSGNSPES